MGAPVQPQPTSLAALWAFLRRGGAMPTGTGYQPPPGNTIGPGPGVQHPSAMMRDDRPYDTGLFPQPVKDFVRAGQAQLQRDLPPRARAATELALWMHPATAAVMTGRMGAHALVNRDPVEGAMAAVFAALSGASLLRKARNPAWALAERLNFRGALAAERALATRAAEGAMVAPSGVEAASVRGLSTALSPEDAAFLRPPETVNLTHYSRNEALSELDPAFQDAPGGIGISTERKRARRAGRPLVPRMSAQDTGAPLADAAFGQPGFRAYSFQLPKSEIYDLGADPLGLTARARANDTLVETEVQAAGYSAMRNSASATPQTVSIFRKVPLTAQHTAEDAAFLAPPVDPNQQISDAIVAQGGGGTFDAATGASLTPPGGGAHPPIYPVADPAHTVAFPENTPAAIAKFRAEHAAALAQPNARVGVWHDPATGAGEINVSLTHDAAGQPHTLDAAHALGRRWGQKAVGHIENSQYIGDIPVPDFPANPNIAMGTGRFFSRAEVAVQDARLTKGTADEWLRYLGKQPMPAQEQSILAQALEGAPGKLTRDEVLTRVQANNIRLGEVQFGDSPVTSARRELDARIEHLGNAEWEPGADTRLNALKKERRALASSPSDPEPMPEQFNRYVEPGPHTNHRAIIITAGEGGGTGVSRVEARVARKRAARLAGTPVPEPYISPHWPDVENPIAHVRLTDRVGPNGEKTLFVEEIQSDLHQAGREEGYRGPLRGADYAEQLRLERKDGNWTDAETTWYNRNVPARPDAGVPDLPFKKTEEWTGLAWRRIMDEAAAGGYDRVAWTTGTQQVRRYSLAKHADQLAYYPPEARASAYPADYATTEGDLRLFKEGKYVTSLILTPEQLPSTIGAELSQRLLAQPTQVGRTGGAIPLHGARVLSGVDLEVGGEGMKAYYDRIVPNVVRDWAKRRGETILIRQHAPEPRSLSNPGAGAFNGTSYIDVPDMLRNKLRVQGQELGAAHPSLLPPIAGTIGGGLAGATQGDTPEARMRNAALGALSGLALGLNGGRIPGLSVRNVSGAERVTRVALRSPTGQIIEGLPGEIHAMTAARFPHLNTDVYESGFLTNTGRYVTRGQAAGVGRRAGQLGRGWKEGMETDASDLGLVGPVRDFSHLTDTELRALASTRARTFVQQYDRSLQAGPTSEQWASGALAGQSQRNWYPDSHAAIAAGYGADAPTAQGIFAAFSPRTKVAENANIAAAVMERWQSAGRPTDPGEVRDVLAETAGWFNRGEFMPAHVPNATRTLRAAPNATPLSGAKVEPFRRNLSGDYNPLTLDAIMGAGAGINAGPNFEGTITAGRDAFGRTLAGTSGAYIGTSQRLRGAAHLLGGDWTPAGVQSANWSFLRPHLERFTAEADVAAGRTGLAVARGSGSLAPEDVPSFATELRRILGSHIPTPGSPAVDPRVPNPEDLQVLIGNVLSSVKGIFRL